MSKVGCGFKEPRVEYHADGSSTSIWHLGCPLWIGKTPWTSWPGRAVFSDLAAVFRFFQRPIDSRPI